MANKGKDSSDESNKSGSIDETNEPNSSEELDKSKTVEEAMSESEESHPDEDTKEMLSPESEIDDDVLAETSKDLSNEESKPAKPPKQPKNWKKFFKILLILILLAGIGFAAWYFLLFKKDNTNSATPQVETQETVQENTNTPDTVVYTYREKATDPDTLYWRPADSGERTKVKTFEKNVTIDHYDVFQNIVTYSTGKEIAVSTDGGRTYKQIVGINDNSASDALGDQVTSLKISRDGKRVAYGFLPENRDGQLFSVDLNGQDKKELLSIADNALFIEAWNASEDKMVYWKGCYNCGGISPNLQIRDLETKKDKQIINKGNAGDYGLADFSVSDDISTLVAVQGSPDPDPGEGLGITLVAPYKINSFDLSNLNKTQIETIGTAGEKNPNGTTKYRQIIVGFVSGTKDIYYTDDNDVYLVKDTEDASLLYNAKDNILHLPFASEEYVVAGAGPVDGDYQLAHYDVSTKKSAQIFIGDNQTTIVGVSTK